MTRVVEKILTSDIIKYMTSTTHDIDYGFACELGYILRRSKL